ncbi:Ger(x)C family spore germination C-terminal domain-containing protein [Paenibacillus oceani]|uniref:Spore germination GerAC-like C-terminal domain-containing protein n=1 Tax=Paenibacillus oceani TaxID=2772510 RepID=A0A927CDH0_9BACL|nr:Ger(x)C family spore germination C-terminal domain-containing protein [Paenibacillus oceani]MBD2864577.1 hypothetical protein [Paenibacillus oceani]
MAGIYFLSQHNDPVFVKDSELTGLRWMEAHSRRGDLVISKDGQPSVSMSIENIRADIRFDEQGGSNRFSVRFSCTATIAELLEGMTEQEIEQETIKAVSSQIRQTFEHGREKGLDLFHLNHELYRQHFPVWSRLTHNGTTPLEDYTLGSIEVSVDLLHSGMYRITKQPKNQY